MDQVDASIGRFARNAQGSVLSLWAANNGQAIVGSAPASTGALPQKAIGFADFRISVRRKVALKGPGSPGDVRHRAMDAGGIAS